MAGALAATAAVLFYVEGWVLRPPKSRKDQAPGGRVSVAPVIGPASASGVVLTVDF